MKKTYSLTLFIVSFLLYFFLSYYIKSPFNYHFADFVSYIFWWSASLFILSILYCFLDNNQYKKWMKASLVVMGASLLLAYINGDGTGGILSINGEIITWFFIGFYSFISVIYFIVQFIKSRRNRIS